MRVVRFLLETLIVRSQSHARLRAEVLALRHQLAVLERQVGRPRWQPTDRLVLATCRARKLDHHRGLEQGRGEDADFASGRLF